MLLYALETHRLRLICCDLPTIEALLAGDAALERKLDIRVAPQWTQFGEPAFRWTLDQLSERPTDCKWFTYLPVLRKQKTLVGSGGYKGVPDADGWVEIGYEIAPGYRQQGLASEMADELVRNALSHSEVKGIRAHTLAQSNTAWDASALASVAVLRKLGFAQTQEILDPDDGPILRWERPR